ncbi:phage antirepressor KilAC domain-containing protein [Corynebacterium freneyi]|uniref:phage antirepressor KilAC domain-containing protein n=1 Tax=Corynebacterium freneyi TaxID=134034 RepID=UPI00068EAC80|nr:phage antirepressor KilAC domain-containing protein [Corynebacterium freneyi]
MKFTIQPFDFRGHEVRVIQGDDGEPRWVAADVAKVLGYSATAAMTRSLDDDEKGVQNLHTPGGEQELATITESGLYSVILRSRVPAARDFKRWVTGEVLPQIRKTGSYSAPLSDDEIVHRALQLTYRKVQELEAKVAEDAPKVAYHDEFVADEDLIQFRTLANQLEVGEKHLRQVLMARGWIYRRDYQRWSNKKNGLVTEYQWRAVADKKRYFRLIPAHDAPRLAGEVRQTLKVTPAGVVAIERAMRRWAAEDVAA